MKFEKLFESPVATFAYLERYVNDGSPSGYTFTSGVSDLYSPRGAPEFFKLPVFSLLRESVTQVGTLANIHWAEALLGQGHVPIPVHPDVLSDVRTGVYLPNEPYLSLSVSPTASGRTVMTDWRDGVVPIFLKLHYPRVIGRFSRGIPLYKWVGSIQSSHYLRAFLRDNEGLLGLFDEFAAIYVEGNAASSGFGSIFRKFPRKALQKGRTALLPAFSLFSRDYKCPADEPLIAQIVRDCRLSVEDFLERYVEPIISSYVILATQAGLLPECQAQNVVFGITAEGYLAGIYLRDMEDVWKDLTRRESLGLDTACVEYHTITHERDADFFKRRSFMYDFKLGEYLLHPLAVAAHLALGISLNDLRLAMQTVGRTAWRAEEDYFQPASRWYCYPNNQVVSRATYLERANPRFR